MKRHSVRKMTSLLKFGLVIVSILALASCVTVVCLSVRHSSCELGVTPTGIPSMATEK